MKSFYKYMTECRLDEYSPVGDLARDMKGDETFPAETSDKKTIAVYLENCGACSGCMDAFVKAYEEYKKWLQKEE